ncbi:MAG: extracellular solute-binding protein family 1, partial [Clostridiales bacterium]|nr:extracellular solute-binding protein family 1 [Clostridiales bacterium]
MNKKLRVKAVVLAMFSLTITLSGCGKLNENKKDANVLKENIKLTWYQPNHSGGELKDMGEAEGFKELEKKTGIDIEWQHPAAGTNENEQLNLIIASNQLPDVIFWNWGGMPGGIAKYLTSKTIIRLNDLVEQHAPNYKKALEKYPDCKKLALLDDGSIPAFYQLDPEPKRTGYWGFVLRADWLEKLNLKEPKTIDEWHTVLKAFKEKDPNGNGKKDELPWSETKSNNPMQYFAAAWGVLDGMYKDPINGKVQYGPLQPGYKDFISTMTDWYKEGLIDSDFASNDSKAFTSKLQGDLVGGSYMTVGGGIGNNTKAARVKLPEFSLAPLAPPAGPSGKAYAASADLIQKVGWAGAITSSGRYPKEAVKMIDYFYSEEGQNLLNWGIEGKSYTVENGKKKFTDIILKDTEGKAPSQAIVHYAFPINGFTKVMDFEPYSQINLVLPEQQKSAEIWSKLDSSLLIPSYMQFST